MRESHYKRNAGMSYADCNHRIQDMAGKAPCMHTYKHCHHAKTIHALLQTAHRCQDAYLATSLPGSAARLLPSAWRAQSAYQSACLSQRHLRSSNPVLLMNASCVSCSSLPISFLCICEHFTSTYHHIVQFRRDRCCSLITSSLWVPAHSLSAPPRNKPLSPCRPVQTSRTQCCLSLGLEYGS